MTNVQTIYKRNKVKKLIVIGSGVMLFGGVMYIYKCKNEQIDVLHKTITDLQNKIVEQDQNIKALRTLLTNSIRNNLNSVQYDDVEIVK